MCNWLDARENCNEFCGEWKNRNRMWNLVDERCTHRAPLLFAFLSKRFHVCIASTKNRQRMLRIPNRNNLRGTDSFTFRKFSEYPKRTNRRPANWKKKKRNSRKKNREGVRANTTIFQTTYQFHPTFVTAELIAWVFFFACLQPSWFTLMTEMVHGDGKPRNSEGRIRASRHDRSNFRRKVTQHKAIVVLGDTNVPRTKLHDKRRRTRNISAFMLSVSEDSPAFANWTVKPVGTDECWQLWRSCVLWTGGRRCFHRPRHFNSIILISEITLVIVWTLWQYCHKWLLVEELDSYRVAISNQSKSQEPSLKITIIENFVLSKIGNFCTPTPVSLIFKMHKICSNICDTISTKVHYTIRSSFLTSPSRLRQFSASQMTLHASDHVDDCIAIH